MFVFTDNDADYELIFPKVHKDNFVDIAGGKGLTSALRAFTLRLWVRLEKALGPVPILSLITLGHSARNISILIDENLNWKYSFGNDRYLFLCFLVSLCLCNSI